MREQTCALCNKKKEHAELIFKAYGKVGNIICKKCVKTCNLLLKQHERKKITNGKDWKDLRSEFSPVKISELLQLDITGHKRFLRGLSVMAYEFCKRICAPDKDTKDKAPVTMLVIGPTGSGKSYSCMVLAEKLSKHMSIPWVKFSCATMSSTGYVGTSPQDAIQSLVQKHENMHGKGSKRPLCGIVILDEVDKIAKSPTAGGQDISGLGVQRELLTLLDGIECNVQSTPSDSWVFGEKKKKPQIDTRNILFMFTGAFADLDYFRNEDGPLGNFGKTELILPKSAREIQKNGGLINALGKYGMLTELLGRMQRIFELNKLTDANYFEITEKHILKKIQAELIGEQINLEWSEDVVLRLIKMAKDKKTGVRGIKSVINELLQETYHSLFGKPRKKPITIKIVTCATQYLKIDKLTSGAGDGCAGE